MNCAVKLSVKCILEASVARLFFLIITNWLYFTRVQFGKQCEVFRERGMCECGVFSTCSVYFHVQMRAQRRYTCRQSFACLFVCMYVCGEACFQCCGCWKKERQRAALSRDTTYHLRGGARDVATRRLLTMNGNLSGQATALIQSLSGCACLVLVSLYGVFLIDSVHW